jgi:UDP-N-acetylmuramate dehydrogenase
MKIMNDHNNTINIIEDLTKELNSVTSLCLNEPLSNHTTFKTGGPADIFVMPSTEDEIRTTLLLCKESSVPLCIIGGGSNLLVADKGIRGVVMKISSGIDSSEISIEDNGSLKVPASLTKQQFVDYSIEHGFSGLQFTAGVPGSVGGGIYMNAGTFMGSFADVMTHINYIDQYGQNRSLEITDDFSSYRKTSLEEGAVIISGIFSLYAGHDPKKLKAEYDEINVDRASKHPLEYPSAGSVFKNPEGHSSWKLVDDAGLKGYTIGGAKVSEKHTNFIINCSNAQSQDILNLIHHIQETVESKFGVKLETEIRRLGDFN